MMPVAMRVQPTSADQWSDFLLDSALYWAAVATLSYNLVLIFRLPVWWWYPLCVGALMAALPVLLRRGCALPPWDRYSGSLVALGLVVAAVNLFTLRPDADDVGFFHRALVAVQDLSKPISFNHTAFDVAELPPASPFHLFTSFEVTGALVAHALGLPVMASISLGLASIAATLVPLVYFRLMRTSGFAPWPAVAGAAAAVAWLLVAGNVHMDWGNYTLLRIWQGKCLMVALHLPLALLYTLRFLLLARGMDLVRLHLVVLTAIGLSGSALFLIPWVVATVVSGFLIATRFRRKSLQRSAGVATILFPVVLAVILPALGLLPAIHDFSIFQVNQRDPIYWLTIVATPGNIMLYLMFFALAWVASQRRLVPGTMISGTAVSILVLVAPPTASLLMDIVTAGVYFRFLYTVPVPFMAGLAMAGVIWKIATVPGPVRYLAATGLIFLMVAVGLVKTPALTRDLIVFPKSHKHRLDILASVEPLAERVQSGALVLAPEEIAVTLALLRPDLKFVATRASDTAHAFRMARLTSYGGARTALQRSLQECLLPAVVDLHALGLQRAIDILIMPERCHDLSFANSVVDENAEKLIINNYVAFIRQ